MAKKYQREAAARAQARKKTVLLSESTGQNCHIQPNFGAPSLDNDSDSDCGYTGGVNHEWVDSNDNSDWSDGSDFNSESLSLSELEGSELEENLQELRKEV